jgi:hypothetical protein
MRSVSCDPYEKQQCISLNRNDMLNRVKEIQCEVLDPFGV